MSSLRRREEKRREQEEYEHQQMLERQAQQARQERQDSCTHYRCVVTRYNWQGQPAEVMCEDCEATNYIEDNEQ